MRTFERSVSGAVHQAFSASKSGFYPWNTIKCDGPAVFRSQTARDVACLLDVDLSVTSWRCQPACSAGNEEAYRPDFRVSFEDGGHRYLDAPDRAKTEASCRKCFDASYRQLSTDEVYEGFRLQNARDLLRYGKWRTSLGDRVRLLAALDEHGSLTLAECLGAIQETRPVAGIASLILSGLIEVDLDLALLGPETLVRRIRP